MTNNLKFYDYYYESYSAVLSNFIGNYEIETENEDGTEGDLQPIPEDSDAEWDMIEEVFNSFMDEQED